MTVQERGAHCALRNKAYRLVYRAKVWGQLIPAPWEDCGNPKREAARILETDPGNLCRMVKGQRHVSPAVLKRLGYWREITIRELHKKARS